MQTSARSNLISLYLIGNFSGELEREPAFIFRQNAAKSNTVKVKCAVALWHVGLVDNLLDSYFLGVSDKEQQ